VLEDRFEKMVTINVNFLIRPSIHQELMRNDKRPPAGTSRNYDNDFTPSGGESGTDSSAENLKLLQLLYVKGFFHGHHLVRL
jgi:hypothetical protein